MIINNNNNNNNNIIIIVVNFKFDNHSDHTRQKWQQKNYSSSAKNKYNVMFLMRDV